jgi:hypothetical protein
MMTDVGDAIRFGNARIDPTTGQPLVDPPSAFHVGGADTDPTTVTLTIQRPDQTQLVYGWPSAGADGTLIREAPGRFYVDVLIDQSGTWRYKLRGTGAVASVEEDSIKIDRSKVA